MPEDIFVIEQGFRVDSHVLISKGKRYVKIPSDWDAQRVRVYPAEVKYYPKRDSPIIASVARSKGGSYVVLPDNFSDDYAIVMKLRKLDFKK